MRVKKGGLFVTPDRYDCNFIANNYVGHWSSLTVYAQIVRDLMLAGFVLLLCVTCNAQDSPFRLPVIDATPPAPQPVEPKPVTVLPEDCFFVIESDVQAIVLHSPDGLLTVSEDQGPIKLRGKFAGGTGRVETKTFSGKFVYTIEGVKAGKAELILIPSGVVSSDQIVRLMLSVNGAQPPPDDEKIEPGPTPTPHSGKVHLDIIEDVNNRTADTSIVLRKVVQWAELIDAGNSYLIRDKDSSAAKMMQADYAGNDLPVVIVRDKDSKKPLRVMPLPKEFETLRTLVKEVAGE